MKHHSFRNFSFPTARKRQKGQFSKNFCAQLALVMRFYRKNGRNHQFGAIFRYITKNFRNVFRFFYFPLFFKPMSLKRVFYGQPVTVSSTMQKMDMLHSPKVDCQRNKMNKKCAMWRLESICAEGVFHFVYHRSLIKLNLSKLHNSIFPIEQKKVQSIKSG